MIYVTGMYNGRYLYVDEGIGKIRHLCISSNQLRESDIKIFFSSYNLSNLLIEFGKRSIKIFFSNENVGVVKIENIDVHIGQFQLIYLSMVSILSTNWYKKEELKYPESAINYLSWFYGTYLLDDIELVKENYEKYFLKMYCTQILESQFDSHIELSRNIFMFFKLLPELMVKYKKLETFFNRILDLMNNEFGIKNIGDYFALINIEINKIKETGSPLIKLNNSSPLYINTKKIIDFYSIDYRKFRTIHDNQNIDIKEHQVRYSYNPLWRYPIIRKDDEFDAYIIPNISILFKKTIDFYWSFGFLYEKYGYNIPKFREKYGYIFEEYVGCVLEKIYDSRTYAGDLYGPNNHQELSDYILEEVDKFYFFDAKADVLDLNAIKHGETEKVCNKLFEHIRQRFDRLMDIKYFHELKKYRSKEIFNIIVLKEIPFIEHAGFYATELNKKIESLANTNIKYKDIKKMKYFFINISDLEHFYLLKDKYKIEEAIGIVYNNNGIGFKSLIDPKDYEKNGFIFDDEVEKILKGIIKK